MQLGVEFHSVSMYYNLYQYRDLLVELSTRGFKLVAFDPNFWSIDPYRVGRVDCFELLFRKTDTSCNIVA